MVNPGLTAVRRRAKELKSAALACADADSAALLLFYSAECFLKAMYMDLNSLRDTEHSTVLDSARSYGHRLDDLIVALRIPPKSVPPRPTIMRLSRTQQVVQVRQLHEAWRYGERLDALADLTAWLGTIVAYVESRI